MQLRVGRRGLLAGGAAVAGGTLALGWHAGKPAAQGVNTPVGAPEAGSVRLQGIGALKRTEPAVMLPEAALVDGDGGEPCGRAFCGARAGAEFVGHLVRAVRRRVAGAGGVGGAGARRGDSVLALSSDRGGAAVVARFYAAHGITGLAVWLDPRGAAARAWGARGLPTTLVVDRAGRERGRLEGAADWGGGCGGGGGAGVGGVGGQCRRIGCRTSFKWLSNGPPAISWVGYPRAAPLLPTKYAK